MPLFESFDSNESKFTAPIQSPDKEIKSYDMTDKLYYPYLLLEIDSTLPEHKLAVLKNSLEELPYIHEKVEEGYYDVILKSAGTIMILGMIHSNNLRAVLQSSLFSDLNKSLRLDERRKVTGSMMYAFCTSPIY